MLPSSYETLDEWLMAHNMTLAEYKYQQTLRKNRIAGMRTIVDRMRKEKEMSKTATIKKRENAPDFVVGSFGYKLEDLKQYVNDKGYINFDILKGKEGGEYVKINDYNLKKESDNVLTFKDDEIPY